MRYCILCKKPMYTSIESIWINGKNYDIHVPCKKRAPERLLTIKHDAKEKNCVGGKDEKQI